LHNFLNAAADLLIADVTAASLGVGYELAYAEARNKPILCLYGKSDGNLSGMVAGNKYFTNKTYSSLEEANKFIDEFIATFKASQNNA
jgi:2'-deoxynucleoside 5'-phosphate N-hydrolase